MNIQNGFAFPLRRSYRDKVVSHAEAWLIPATLEANPDVISRAIRRFLKTEDTRLRIAHNLEASGYDTAATRSFVLDIAVKSAFQHAARIAEFSDPQNGCALLALGGYGRGELAPYSDLDLLFLYNRHKLSQMKPVLAHLLQLLWDSGLKVGHGFRTVGDCIASALDDGHLRTALVHTRFLAGNRGLHNSLSDALEKDRRRHADSFITAVNRARDARCSRFGATVCLQEPNIKETAGGLRDFHTALWLIHARHGYRRLEEARAHNLVSESEARKALRAYDFLWRVRNAAHFLTRRKTETLSLDLQTTLALQFGYRPGVHLLGSEKFMRDYYRHAKELSLFLEAVSSRVADNEGRPSRSWRKRSDERVHEPFAIRKRRLQFDGEPGFFSSNPLAILNAFALAQAARVPFDYRLHHAVLHGSRSIGPATRSSAEIVRAFLALLRRRGRVGYVLRAMHNVGLLARLIPEFGNISLLVQHDLYHHFTVDEHTLRAIDAIDDLHISENKHRAQFRAVLEQVEDPTLLYLALLLHDIGKGQGRGHIGRGVKLAERICRRLGLKEEPAKQIVLLVKHHVTMAHLALRRDLNEARLISDFAASLGSLDALNMLFLLTYADLNAVGPGVWSEWKGSLLWDLYRRTKKVITGDDAPIDIAAELSRIKAEIVAALNSTVPLSEVERHLALLPDRYLRVTPPSAVASHLQMIEAVRAEGFSCRWTPQNHASTELTVVAHDRHGLFANLAGTVAANGIEILSAEVNTREDGIAIDTFILRQASTRQAIESQRCQAIERALRQAGTGSLDVAASVERWNTANAPRKKSRAVLARHRNLPQVICDNEISVSSTLIEVHAIDEPGLAYRIAAVLAGLGLEIICARIATERSDALDVFYVTDGNGLKLSDDMMESVKRELMDKLPGTANTVTAFGPGKISGSEMNEKSRSDHQAASVGCR
jgi:[protein-PII] uridylyltransferase